MENYEQKYKEALEKLRNLHDNYDSISSLVNFKEELEGIFTELKESKDEKIIKALKEGFKYHQLLNPTFGGVPCTEIVNWLEKQGEQKPAWSEEDEERYLSCLKRLGTGDIRQPETINTVWLKSIKDRVQPKVELTQLDKNILEAAIAFVEQNNHFNVWCGVDKHTVLSALHSIRPQKQWKPSEEQMKQLGWVAKQNKDNMIGKELMTLYNDLKNNFYGE